MDIKVDDLRKLIHHVAAIISFLLIQSTQIYVALTTFSTFDMLISSGSTYEFKYVIQINIQSEVNTYLPI